MSETNESRAFNWFTPWRFGILLALLIFATFPQVILGLQTFVVRDYAFFSYPLAHFQKECFWRGEIPFWNPYNNCGIPFLAQWNTMPLYPPALIYLLLPLGWSLSFFCLLHLWFAGFGMFFLARKWTENNFAAAFAGTVFSFNGLTLNLLMWPSHIATLSWMPWVVLAVESAWREGGRKIIFAALAGAMQMLAGGPETIFMTWVLLLALWIQQFFKNESPRGAMLWRFPLIVFLVATLAAAQLLPFLDFAHHSQRYTGFADLRWSMPGWGWANFLVPMAFGGTWNENVFYQYNQSWTSSYYLGIGALWLALFALWKARERRVRLLGVAAVIALIFAFGRNTFIYRGLRELIPQLGLITYPIKFVTLVAFIAPLLAAFALARLKNGGSEKKSSAQKSIVSIGIILFVLLAGILLSAWRFPFPTDDVRATLFNGLTRAIFLIVTGAILICLTDTRLKLSRAAPLLLIAVAWLDVLTHEPTQNPTVSPSVYQLNLARERLAMSPQPALGQSRAMLAPSVLFKLYYVAVREPKNEFLAKRLGYFADCNLLDAVPKVDGFFSLYTLENGNLIDLLNSSPDADLARLEDFMSVSQISSPTNFYSWQPRRTFLPMVTAGQRPIFLDRTNAFDELKQTNFDGSKTVYLPSGAKASVIITNQTKARILSSHFENNRVEIEVQAEETSMVVISQTYYHDWRAFVDGRPIPLFRANYAFQAVQVPAGQHHIQLIYQDRAFEIGTVISLFALAGCLIALRVWKNCEQFDDNFSSTKKSARC
jgi:Bacterial membrane protein YfhO